MQWRSTVRLSIVLSVILVLVVGTAAWADTDPALQGKLLARSDGAYFIYQDGYKKPIALADIGDDAINAIPDSPPPLPPAPAFTPEGTLLQMGDTWVGDGISVRTRADNPHDNLAIWTVVFTNTGSVPLTFKIPRDLITLDSSRGVHWVAQTDLTVDDLEGGQSRTLEPNLFNFLDGKFVELMRNQSETSYTLTVKKFIGRLPEMRWIKTIPR